jgi:hypothetical protein
MLIVQEMWKNSLNHSSIIAKHQFTYVSVYFNNSKMQLVNNSFKILKVNGSTHVHMLNIEKMWKIISWFTKLTKLPPRLWRNSVRDRIIPCPDALKKMGERKLMALFSLVGRGRKLHQFPGTEFTNLAPRLWRNWIRDLNIPCPDALKKMGERKLMALF